MWMVAGVQTGCKETSIKMGSKRYYDRLFRNNRDYCWDDAPGKLVILQAFIHLVRRQVNNILDIGCGSGYFINEIKKINPIMDYK